jgi:hypothetical protein
MGNVGSQGITSMTNLGQAQQADPLLAASALGKIIGGINTPTTTTNATQLSPLNQIGSIASALGGSISGTDTLLKQLFPAQGKPGEPGYKPAGGLSSFLKTIGIGSGSNPTGTPPVSITNPDSAPPGSTPVDDNGNLNPGYTQNPDGSYTYTGNLPTPPEPTTPEPTPPEPPPEVPPSDTPPAEGP